MSESSFYCISQTGDINCLATVDEALAAVKDGDFLWLDYCQPTKEELSLLIDRLGIHPLSVEDCIDDSQVPKIEDFPQNYFILFNIFSYSEGELSIGEVDFIIGGKFLVTVSGRDANDRRQINNILRVVKAEIHSARQGPAFLMHVILDFIVDQKFNAIEALEEELDAVEEIILTDIDKVKPADLISLRHDLLVLRKNLFHEREILVKICRKDCPFIPDDAIFHYRDIYDHLVKFFELAETNREFVSSLMEIHLSMVNNQMAKSANETNSTVRRLTFITTIFMPLTLISGIGGMSEWTMMTGAENWKIAYSLLLIAMVIIGIANYYLLKRLEKKDRQ